MFTVHSPVYKCGPYSVPAYIDTITLTTTISNGSVTFYTYLTPTRTTVTQHTIKHQPVTRILFVCRTPTSWYFGCAISQASTVPMRYIYAPRALLQVKAEAHTGAYSRP